MGRLTRASSTRAQSRTYRLRLPTSSRNERPSQQGAAESATAFHCQGPDRPGVKHWLADNDHDEHDCALGWEIDERGDWISGLS
jgi:hypothetical protein